MGLSSNQARFLALTSRQVDLEHRIQQICQRRLRLTSELENVATSYNNSISNRKMYTQSLAGMQQLSVTNLSAAGYKVIDSSSHKILNAQQVTTPSGFTSINTQADFMNLVSTLNSGSGLNGKYILNCNIDLSSSPVLSNSLITQTFAGTFDGNGHTVSGLNINTGGAVMDNVGMFSQNTGTIQNIIIENATINASRSSDVGALVGNNDGGTVTNCSSSGSVAGGTADNSNLYSGAGGLVGNNEGTVSYCSSSATVAGDCVVGGLVGRNNNILTNSFATGNVSATCMTFSAVGGLTGASWGSSTVDQCYATGNVSGGKNVGGLVGDFTAPTASDVTVISNSYATGNVSTNDSGGGLIGAIGSFGGTETVTNSYATGNVSGSSPVGGILGRWDGGNGTVNTTNFYKNNLSVAVGSATYVPPSAINENVSATRPQDSWSNIIWDKSTTIPTLKNSGYQGFAVDIDENLRNGTYSLVKDADEFTQDPLDINNEEYQEVDWRATPEIFDELYKGDDVEAENKYDKTVDEINSQDKKLQLEQTTIEVEYKAISSERESVKKILDTNAQSSFKYFS